jgi:hypothetical protein
MVVQTAFVFWHASTIPKLQIPVFPPSPRLAKLSIAAVEPIDEVDGGRGARPCARGSGCGLCLVEGMISPSPTKPKPDRLSPISISSSAVFWFLFWFEGWFHPFSDDESKQIESRSIPESIDFTEGLEGETQSESGTRGEGRTLNLRLRSPTITLF